MAKTPPPTTVKTRIAIAVDSKGNWHASGYGTAKKTNDDKTSSGEALDNLYSSAFIQHVVFVEAEVPVPQKHGDTVQGVVVGEPKPRKKA